QWATRGDKLARVFGGSDADGLPARGKLGAELQALIQTGGLSLVDNFRIDEVRQSADQLNVMGTRDGQICVLKNVDSIIAATGQRPDLAMNRELRLGLDSALECVEELGPLIDPNEH